MEIEKNHFLSEMVNKFTIEVLDSGIVETGIEWSNKNVCSPFSRLYYVESGEGIIKYNNIKLVIKPGNVYLIPAGLKYSYCCESHLKKLFFHINVFKPDGYDLFVNSVKCFSIKLNIEKINELSDIYKSTSIADILTLKEELYHRVSLFIPQLNIEQLSNTRYSKIVQNSIDYIQLNLSNNLTLNEIAEKIYTSENTLRKKFKEEIGVSIGKYIDDLIFFTAEKLLQKSEWSIGQISENLGFCDQFYFSRRFKEKYGITPSSYRKIGKTIL